MKELIKQYLDNGISRRTLMRGLATAGLTAAAAKGLADSFTPTAAEAATPGAIRSFTGTGGAHYIQQLKSAGVEFIFFNPSTGDAPIYDALVSVPEIQLIKGIHEGAVVAMADGYARLSGKVGVAQIANVGLPNGMTQLVNSWKDRIPVLLTCAAFGSEVAGRDNPQDYDHQEPMLSPITKWFWLAQNTRGIADVTRRAIKFASTPPTGPVFLSIPDDLLREVATADIYDRKLFDVPFRVRPDQRDVDAVARMLIEAKNPLISAGDEVTSCQAEAELSQLATMLGIPVTMGAGSALGSWSKPFSTRDPLFIGAFQRESRFPGAVDVHFAIGDQIAERPMRGATLISMRRSPEGAAKAWPVDMPIVSDIKLGLADIIASVKSQLTAQRLQAIAEQRAGRVHDYSAGMARMIASIGKNLNSGNSISMERLGVELEKGLETDPIWVSDCAICQVCSLATGLPTPRPS